MAWRLTAEQRDQIAADAARRYADGEVWQQIGASYGITGEHVRRLTSAAKTSPTDAGGSAPPSTPRRSVSDVMNDRPSARSPRVSAALAKPCALRLNPPAEPPRRAAPVSPRAVGPPPPSSSIYEECPLAPRARPGVRNIRWEKGWALAEACRALIDDGIPMETLSRDLGRGPTWIHWLLGCHDLRVPTRATRSTARRTRR